MVLPALADPSPAPDPPATDTAPDQYRGALLTLFAAAALGSIVSLVAGFSLANPVLPDVAVTLLIASGVLAGIAVTRARRTTGSAALEVPAAPERESEFPRTFAEQQLAGAVALPAESAPPSPAIVPQPTTTARLGEIAAQARASIARAQSLSGRDIRIGTVAAGAIGILSMRLIRLEALPLEPIIAAIAAAACVAAAGLTASAVRYLSDVDRSEFPESVALARGGRIVAWMAVTAAASIGLQWADRQASVRFVAAIVAVINIALCYGLAVVDRQADERDAVFPLDLGVLSLLGARGNVGGSVLDAAERQLGIDLRSTWALTVVRRGLEPLVIGLCFLGWLSTSLTVVGVQDQGLVERFGVPLAGAPLQPGLHLHWPWPVDKVFRISAQRAQTLTVGHEGQEEAGPEDVLWARQHAANEYTLLLGNGRDLITVDAAVQFRIVDVRAWQYHSQNPGDALRAIAHRAVMRTTVNRTLAEALSENVVATTGRMRAMVQQEADALGLGVQVLGFTVGGMHPPVTVAGDYQAVVSAELRKVTAVVDAEVFRNRTVPYAQSAAVVGSNAAIAEGAQALARAAGEAWSFLTLQSQYGAAPDEFFFRRRLETLEKGLATRRFTILDYRFQRDGGELWVTP
jgi:regulator of protease activity HflC (stomatin/prohibitin superfamily)